MAHEAQAGPSGDKIKLPLTISLGRAQALRLTARAIREGNNLDALVAEILEGASTREVKQTDARRPLPRRESP
jgi:hypothetical protein